MRFQPGAEGPVHTIDREQLWMQTAGTVTVTADGRVETVTAGQAVILPAGCVRQFRTSGEQAAEALVAMPAGGRASTPDDRTTTHRLPWAE